MIVLTRGTAFALCLSQAAVMIGVISFYPPVEIEIYTVHPVITNGTLDLLNTISSPRNFTTLITSLSLPFLILSALAAIFSTTTAGLAERGILQDNNQYTYETLMETGLWDLIFWFHCAFTHALILLIIMSPADAYAVALASILVIYFLCRLCQPRYTQLNMTQENLNLIGFWAGLLIALYNLPDTHTARLASVLIMCLLDYMLGVGHTWDASPTMDVITNCRLFWVCSSSFCMAALYGAWHDHLLLERH